MRPVSSYSCDSSLKNTGRVGCCWPSHWFYENLGPSTLTIVTKNHWGAFRDLLQVEGSLGRLANARHCPGAVWV